MKKSNKIYWLIVALVFVSLLISNVCYAQDEEIKIIEYALKGDKTGLIAAGVLFLVWAIRNLIAPKFAKVNNILKSDIAGVLLSYVVAFGLALGTSKEIAWATVLLAAKSALIASGGFSFVKKLLIPIGEKIKPNNQN